MSNLPPKAEWSLLKSWLRLFPHSSTRHDGLLQLKTATPRKPETEPYSTCAPIAALFRYATTCYGPFRGNRPQNPIPTTFLTAKPIVSAYLTEGTWPPGNISPRFNTRLQFNNPSPQHLPRGLAQRAFSQPPRRSRSRLQIPHGSPRRSAKDPRLYVTPLQ